MRSFAHDTHTHTYIHTPWHTHTYIYTHTYISQRSTHLHMQYTRFEHLGYIYIYIYIYLHTHAHTHTYIHTHIHVTDEHTPTHAVHKIRTPWEILFEFFLFYFESAKQYFGDFFFSWKKIF